jgi:hypothetical protein
MGGRAVRVPALGIGAVALGAVLLLPVMTLATAGIAVFLLLRAVTHAPLSTISYPLAEMGARIAGIGGGTAIGLINVAWAGAAAVAPVVGGALVAGVGARATFACVALLTVAVGAWILWSDRREVARATAAEATA